MLFDKVNLVAPIPLTDLGYLLTEMKMAETTEV